jgi:bacillithiol system protein YtxJ
MGIERVYDEETLDEALRSEQAVLYKHSSACRISDRAIREVEAFAKEHPAVSVYVVDVRESRDLSQKIAADLGIGHESPQVIVVKNGRAQWHASQFGITAEALSQALEAA